MSERVVKQKLSIYPEPEPKIELVETHSELEGYIREARLATTAAYEQVHDTVRKGINDWIGVEEAVESRSCTASKAQHLLNFS